MQYQSDWVFLLHLLQSTMHIVLVCYKFSYISLYSFAIMLHLLIWWRFTYCSIDIGSANAHHKHVGAKHQKPDYIGQNLCKGIAWKIRLYYIEYDKQETSQIQDKIGSFVQRQEFICMTDQVAYFLMIEPFSNFPPAVHFFLKLSLKTVNSS